jgi:hypothetical protein
MENSIRNLTIGQTYYDVKINTDSKVLHHTEWRTDFCSSDSSDLIDSAEEVRTAEVGLFRAVIMQALLDAVSQSKRTEEKMEKMKARRWFDVNNKDFLTVCEFAQLSPEWVIIKSRKAIASGCKWRKESCEV